MRRSLTDTAVAAVRLDASHAKAFYLAGMARLDLGRFDPTLDPKSRVVMLQMAVETLMQASELSDEEAVDLKVIEATKEMEKTLKDLEELGKKGLLKRPTPTKPAASEEEKEEEAQLKLRDQMPIKVEALTLEEKEQLGSRLANGDGVGMVV